MFNKNVINKNIKTIFM